MMTARMSQLIATRSNPGGPTLVKAETCRFEFLGGACLSFPIPRKARYYERRFRTQNFFAPDDAAVYYESRGTDRVAQFGTLYQGTWFYRGLPLIQPRLADLTLFVLLMRPRDEVNLFDQDEFEASVRRYVADRWRERYDAPRDWAVRDIAGTSWRHYDIVYLKNPGVRTQEWCTPLTSRHFIVMRFEKILRDEASNCPMPMQALTDAIMEGTRLKGVEGIGESPTSRSGVG